MLVTVLCIPLTKNDLLLLLQMGIMYILHIYMYLHLILHQSSPPPFPTGKHPQQAILTSFPYRSLLEGCLTKGFLSSLLESISSKLLHHMFEVRFHVALCVIERSITVICV